MSCTAEEIARKKREALERLKQTKALAQTGNVPSKNTSPGTAAKATSVFYGNTSNDKANTLNQYENKMKQQQTPSHNNRISSQPYPRNSVQNTAAQNTNLNQRTWASIMAKPVTCTCSMISSTRFQVVQSGYHNKLIDVFKTIPTRSYDPKDKIWSFNLSDYEEVQKKVSALNPNVAIGPLPKFVLKLLKEEEKELDFLCLQAIEPTLSSQLLGFQKYGVAFGISNGGRCLIADDMGLGKTYQAIAIADFYKDDWPLLIVTTATARDGWAQHINNLLPAISNGSVKVLTSTNEYVGDYKVLITSYSLMDKNVETLLKRSFGCVILDESHTIKNHKTKSAQSATRLCEKAKRIILLSGTPALSRPNELFCQLSLIDKNFFGGFKPYAVRYCDAKETNFGLDSSGSSNLPELNIILRRKFMIRRTKESVQFELGEKSRETILLDSKKVWNTHDDSMRETIENCKEFNEDVKKLQGQDRKAVLLRLYAESAILKANAVCSYVTDLVKQKTKFIIFGHHKVMMDALSKCLTGLNTNFIRIDGSTRNDLRATYIDKFQNNKSCQVAVLSLQACNAAITLTAASLVVFAELDWNPSTLAQCESRAHRIGQKSPVTCRYLLAKGTVDDYMWNMVKGKQDVLNKAGIFSEDLTDATHSTVTVSAQSSDQTIDRYFESPKSAEGGQINNNNNGDQTSVQPAVESMDYHHILDDDADDALMLDLDF
ncbi:SWI/SNF-related matrix-associated actin-dependent regulator of chromatin subfamily A-like protein 1 [Sitodiplosis mosellana]|uniref:SWI/SNF-related matrix-associated actin-dependent regulator of chromatin subfamily A-like protein 1 n=1 Tax=Sitodiplosis mosellana TaxID=263140 RepID=UPI0024438505|nr:SWI/SNF-related matrix-associated actin-dependent regulator of chromatin subfamily A-like protein 1 [Sitodiplosis mosellana]